MIGQARWGTWETNSSSVHQVIIRMDEPQLTDKPDDGLIIRHTEFNLRDDEMTTAQQKLDVIVECIIQDESGEHKDILRNIFHLIEILQSRDITITIDDESFEQHNYPAISDDIIEKILDMLINEPEKIAILLFDPTSKITGDWNTYKYEDSTKLMYEDSPGYKEFQVITGDY